MDGTIFKGKKNMGVVMKEAMRQKEDITSGAKQLFTTLVAHQHHIGELL